MQRIINMMSHLYMSHPFSQKIIETNYIAYTTSVHFYLINIMFPKISCAITVLKFSKTERCQNIKCYQAQLHLNVRDWS